MCAKLKKGFSVMSFFALKSNGNKCDGKMCKGQWQKIFYLFYNLTHLDPIFTCVFYRILISQEICVSKLFAKLKELYKKSMVKNIVTLSLTVFS